MKISTKLILAVITLLLFSPSNISAQSARKLRKNADKCISNKDYECAIENLSKLIDKNEMDPEPYYLRGVCFYAQYLGGEVPNVQNQEI